MKRIFKSATALTLTASMVLSGYEGILTVTAGEEDLSEIVTTNTKYTDISDFDLEDVLLEDQYYINAYDKDVEYLLEFNNDKLLATFRKTAGISTTETPYKGWESSLMGGHTIGHYLIACAQAWASPNVTTANKTVLYNKMTSIIDGLLECQQKTKGATGFIFGATIISSNNVEKQFDNVENRKANDSLNMVTEAWVPWYTMYNILTGLIEVYNITGYNNAITIASGLGDWTYNRASKWSDETRNIVLAIEYGGMNECLYDLYQLTGNENHAKAAHIFDEITLFEKVKSGKANALQNIHANTTIPKFMGALNRYIQLDGETIDGKTVDASAYLEYAEVFWETVINKHTYITGDNSQWEHFRADNILDGERTNCNCETCNAYNMLKFSRDLFMITGDQKYADYYENTLINSIMASQNPETGMSTYFQAMSTGYFKAFGEKWTKFWCCTGSGMENFTKLQDSVYFYKDNTVIVNQYLSTTLSWKEKNLQLKQETNIPENDTAKFTVGAINDADPITAESISLRIPDWTAGDVTVTVNGISDTFNADSGYLTIEVSIGDVIEIQLPMEVVAYSLPDNNSVYAFKYGPVVLSARLGTDSMVMTTTGVNVSIAAEKKVDNEYLTLTDYSISSVGAYMDNINDYLVKTDGKMEFTLTGASSELTFIPYYQEYEQRYGIYWYFLSDDAEIESTMTISSKEAGRFENEKLDTVQPGYSQYESDELHNMQESNTGIANGGTYRYAQVGGYFSYRMLVDTEEDNYLVTSFAKADNGKTMKITVGDSVIYNETLSYEGDEEYYQVEILIPADAIQANTETVQVDGVEKTAVRIQFQSSSDTEESAKICQFIYTRKAYTSNAQLNSLVSSKGTLKTEGNTYNITIPSTAVSTDITFDIADTYGYVTLDGFAINDSAAKTISVSSRTKTIALRVYAEDHTTYQDYTINILKLLDLNLVDSSISYFVDCGDYNTSTVSTGDKFGAHNSVTEQVYGKDPITGYKWGIIDGDGTTDIDSDTGYGIRTENTWAYEFYDIYSDVPKTDSNRYTKNQFENGIETRYLDYAFELENGTYEVEIGFTDPWGCSIYPSVYANIDKSNKVTLAQQQNVKTNSVVTGRVTVTDGELTLNARGTGTDTLAINMTYIIIKPTSTVKVTNVKLNKKSEVLTVGETLNLTATVSPVAATNKKINWTSSDTSVATVNAGKVTAKKAGKATIRATAADGSKKYAECIITVAAKSKKVTVKAKGFTLKNNTIYLVKNKKATLNASVSPSNAKQGVKFSSNKPGTVSVNSKGVLTAKKTGTATITVKSKDGLKNKKITVNVVKKAVKNTKLSVAKKVTVKVKKTKALNVTVSKKTTQIVKFSSNKKKTATVNQYGVITGKKKGTATITVKCGSITKKVTVTVKK